MDIPRISSRDAPESGVIEKPGVIIGPGESPTTIRIHLAHGRAGNGVDMLPSAYFFEQRGRGIASHGPGVALVFRKTSRKLTIARKSRLAGMARSLQ